jgi:hemerythrin-like domain-containing protein
MLESKGMPRSGGPLGVMLHEHEMGRALVRQMSEAAEAHATGDAEAARSWSHSAHAYADLLRAHIAKENNILLVLAERLLSDEEQTALAAAFEKLGVERIGAGTHEWLHESMKQMIEENPIA